MTLWTGSPNEVVSQKSIPAQIRQPILYVSKNTRHVDDFEQKWTLQKRRFKHFL